MNKWHWQQTHSFYRRRQIDKKRRQEQRDIALFCMIGVIAWAAFQFLLFN